MLDFATLPAAETVTRYAAAHPVQVKLRAMLAEMSEADLDAVERGLEFYQREGMVTRMLHSLLNAEPRAMAA